MEAYGVNEPLILELQTLYSAFCEMENVNEEIPILINQTIEKIRGNDIGNIKELYGIYIMLGLIQECNDLGLDVLLGEIKKHIS